MELGIKLPIGVTDVLGLFQATSFSLRECNPLGLPFSNLATV